jgi:uncharacterized membrane protein
MNDKDGTPQAAHVIHRRTLLGAFRSNFLTGLGVILPIGMTIWLIWTFVGWIDGWVLPFVPHTWRPDTLLGDYLGYAPPVSVRGVGVVIFLVFTVLVGWIAKGLIGRSLLSWGEDLVGRMPLVRSVYNGLKQIADSLLRQDDAKFDRACLIEFPRKGIWAVGFVSTPAKGEIAEKIPDEEILTVFLATNVVPPSGFLLYVPRRDVILLEKMTVEDTAKLILSAGLVYPAEKGEDTATRRLSGRPKLPKAG